MIWNKNLNAYFYHGLYWVIFYSITFIFIKAYALELGASNFFIGLIGAIPFVSIFVAEIPGALLGNKYDHKKIAVISTLIGKLFWIGIIISGALFSSKALYFVLLFFFLSELFTWLSDPPWVEIIAEIVPEKIRGNYMAYRDRAITIAKMITILATGFFIERMPDKLFGYHTLFFIAVLFGMGSVYYMNKVEVKQKPKHKIYNFKDFLKTKGTFRRFLTYSFYFKFAHNFASPFFIVYLLKNVGLSLGAYSLVLTIGAISSIIAYKRIGFFTDKYGDRNMHVFFLIGTALTPLFYLLFVHPSTIWMLIPVSIINGVSWGGFNLTEKNLLLNVISKGDKELQVAEYKTLTALPVIIAPLIAGFIADNVTFVISGIPLVFAIAFVLRASSILFILRVPSIRVKKKIRIDKFLEEFFRLPHFKTYHFSK